MNNEDDSGEDAMMEAGVHAPGGIIIDDEQGDVLHHHNHTAMERSNTIDIVLADETGTRDITAAASSEGAFPALRAHVQHGSDNEV